MDQNPNDSNTPSQPNLSNMALNNQQIPQFPSHFPGVQQAQNPLYYANYNQQTPQFPSHIPGGQQPQYPNTSFLNMPYNSNMPYNPNMMFPNMSYNPNAPNYGMSSNQNVPFPGMQNVGSQPQYVNVEDDVAPVTVGRATVRERREFTIEEDNRLISAFLNTSIDPIVGTSQKVTHFWSKIHKLFSEAREYSPSTMHDRSEGMLKNRWSRLQEKLETFIECYTDASSSRRSGMNEDDILSLALATYHRQKGTHFKFLEQWKTLTKFSKWESVFKSKSSIKVTEDIHTTESEGSNKRVRLEDEGDEIPTPEDTLMNSERSETDFGTSSRPIGNKKAKKAAKGKGKESASKVSDKAQVMKETMHDRYMLQQELMAKQMEADAVAHQRKVEEHSLRLLERKTELMNTLANKGLQNLTEAELKMWNKLGNELGYF